jgi:carbon-monoxide dehydrogenase medium subunit
MKAAPFRYASPSSVAEAVALLASDEGAKPISGGQSLMPMMAFRLAAPTLLVDLRKIPDLDRIAIDANGVRLGARVRWRDILSDERLATAHPLLRNAISHVAHYQVRNRGTVGGSLAHADPAAEMPGIAATVGAEITVVGAAGTRIVAAKDFFVGPLQTVLDAGELIVEVALPAWRPGRRWAFEEFARRERPFRRDRRNQRPAPAHRGRGRPQRPGGRREHDRRGRARGRGGRRSFRRPARERRLSPLAHPGARGTRPGPRRGATLKAAGS